MDILSQHLFPLVPTNPPHAGDYQWNGAFALAKERGVTPRSLAEGVAENFRSDPTFSSVTVAGAGFVCVTLDDVWLADRVTAVVSDPYLGVPQDNSHTVVIDFSSPNVAKRMHVGHLRSTVIGAALDRLNRACGHRTIGDNHLGDWGTPFGKLIVAWQRWRDADAFHADPVAELERLYVKFGREAEKDESLEDEARAATVRLQKADRHCVELWDLFQSVSRTEYQRVYDRLGVTFDETLGESTYESELDPLVDRLLKEGIATESEGAVVVEIGEDTPPLIIRKQDGASLYGTTDLATLAFRRDAFAPDTLLYVTDKRQALHFKQVFHAGRLAQLVAPDTDLVHVGFGMLRLPVTDDTVVMSSRKGNTIPLTKLLDEAHARARAVLDTAPGHAHVTDTMSEAEKEKIAEAVGVSAIIYADLSRDPTSDVTFEWDRVLSLEGNTAPYLMYALARCHGILRKAGVQPMAKLLLGTPEERALALALVRYPDAVVEATNTNRPNVLAMHLYNLASIFFKFYGACPVISPEGVVDGSRLQLVHATLTVLYGGFAILGIRPLERM